MPRSARLDNMRLTAAYRPPSGQASQHYLGARRTSTSPTSKRTAWGPTVETSTKPGASAADHSPRSELPLRRDGRAFLCSRGAVTDHLLRGSLVRGDYGCLL